MSAPRLVAGALVALSLALAMGPAAAWQVEAGAGHESLDGDRGRWRQADLALRGDVAPGRALALTARRTERFGRDDEELGLRLDGRGDDGWSHAVAATVSPSHHVLARWTLGAEVRRALGGGWVVGGGLRHARYAAAGATTLGLDAERYFGDARWGEWRAALALSATRLDGGGAGEGLKLQVDRYIGDGARLGLILASGREPDTAEDGSVRIPRVDTVAVLGRWPLGPRWALVGDLGTTRVAGAYRRTGGRLGVQLDL